MKKSVLLLAATFGVTGAFAQDLTSKKGEPYLPEAGDYSIGVDATPFLNYAGQLLSTAGSTAPTWDHYGLNQTIIGKKFKDEKTAYRGILRIGFNRETMKSEKNQWVATAPTPPTGAVAEDPNEKVIDKMSSTDRFIGLGAGIEYRRGKTRLQGFYGADAFLWNAATTSKYKYGNELNQDATNNLDADNGTYVTDFGSNIVGSIPGYLNVDAARVLKSKTGGQVGIGIRGFVGAEYFVLPKISIAGEFGWGIGYYVNTKDKVTYEAEGTDTGSGKQGAATEIKYKDGVNGGSGFILDTDRNAANGAAYNFAPSGTLRLNFHF